MSARTLILAVAAFALLGVLVFFALRSQRVLENGLPAREVCTSLADAKERATAYATDKGGTVWPVLGTGSMAPFIPAGEPAEIVAYAVTDPARSFGSIAAGDLCIYRAEWRNGLVIHQAAQKTGAGWIMTGLNNREYEGRTPVSAAEFVGVVECVFVVGGKK